MDRGTSRIISSRSSRTTRSYMLYLSDVLGSFLFGTRTVGLRVALLGAPPRVEAEGFSSWTQPLSAREASELLDGDWLTSDRLSQSLPLGTSRRALGCLDFLPLFSRPLWFWGPSFFGAGPHPLARTFHSRPTGVALWSSLLWSSLSSSTGLLTGSPCLNTRPQVGGQSRAPEAPAWRLSPIFIRERDCRCWSLSRLLRRRLRLLRCNQSDLTVLRAEDGWGGSGGAAGGPAFDMFDSPGNHHSSPMLKSLQRPRGPTQCLRPPLHISLTPGCETGWEVSGVSGWTRAKMAPPPSCPQTSTLVQVQTVVYVHHISMDRFQGKSTGRLAMISNYCAFPRSPNNPSVDSSRGTEHGKAPIQTRQVLI